jgi:psp operon transcriptional activator
MVDKGRFRADLLDRLSFDVITLPPLRARDGDIAQLADFFGRRMAAELDWPRWPGFDTEAMAEMEAYPWPGNIRELRNVAERAVYRWDDTSLPVGNIVFDPFVSPWQPVTGQEMAEAAPTELPANDAPPLALPEDFRAAVHAYERSLLEEALRRHRHNQRATAKALGLSYDQLRHCLKKHGLLEVAG